MANNIELNSGSGGAIVAADDVSNIWYQRIKLTAGGEDAAAYGATPYYYLSNSEANEDAKAVKASAGIVYSVVVTNTNTSPCYFRLYNLASGATSASTPIAVYAVPGAGGIAINFTNGMALATGISFRLTTTSIVTSSAAVATGEVIVNIGYV